MENVFERKWKISKPRKKYSISKKEGNFENSKIKKLAKSQKKKKNKKHENLINLISIYFHPISFRQPNSKEIIKYKRKSHKIFSIFIIFLFFFCFSKSSILQVNFYCNFLPRVCVCICEMWALLLLLLFFPLFSFH